MSNLILTKYRRNGVLEFWNGNSWTRDNKKAKQLPATRENNNYMETLFKKFEKNKRNIMGSIVLCADVKNIDMDWFYR